MEAKDQKTTHATDTPAAADAARKEEATSSETLDDLEATLPAGSAKSGTASDTSDASSVPAPDGAPDPDRSGGRADGGDTGGPM
jgi:hypothetical protein